MDTNLSPAITSICAQAHAGEAHSIRLSVDQCVASHTVIRVQGWNLVETDDDRIIFSCGEKEKDLAEIFWNRTVDTEISIPGNGHFGHVSRGGANSYQWQIQWSKVLDRVLQG